MGEIVLVRHGETEWSAAGRHTSRTDLELTEAGRRSAQRLGAALRERSWAAVFCSPRRRARQTAELGELPVTGIDDDLAEWDYGRYEGITTAQIHQTDPGWSLWTDGAPDGESPEQIGARVDRLLARVRPLLDQGDVGLVGHGHCLRVVGARWLALPPSAGGKLGLDTATQSVLGFEHGNPVLERWNVPAAMA